MKLFDVEQSAQEGITDSGSMDPTESYKSMQKQNKFEKKSFDGFKV
jgi:hypothetical protein